MSSSVDLTSPGTTANPYPAFELMRSESPVRHEGENEVWSALTFEHVFDVLRDHKRFSSSTFGESGTGDMPLVLINDDPPRHTRFRQLVNRSFTPRTIAELEPWLETTINELLDKIGDGPTDFVPEYAVPLPVRTIATLLGIPASDYLKFKAWTDNLLMGAGDDGMQDRMGGVMEMVGYLTETIAARKAEPLDDLITLVTQGEIDGDNLTDGEALGYAILLLVAGNETTTNLLGNMMNLLSHRADIWDQLKADPELVDQFVEEMVRYESPVQFLMRTTTEDVEMGGKTIPKGALINVHYGSANRDPEAFDRPDEFRLDRDLRNHVGFGAGVHYCLGSPLARAEARLTVRAMLKRYARIESAGDAVRQDSTPIIFGFKNLPLQLVRE